MKKVPEIPFGDTSQNAMKKATETSKDAMDQVMNAAANSYPSIPLIESIEQIDEKLKSSHEGLVQMIEEQDKTPDSEDHEAK